jgi:hypothetical protein
VHMRVRHAASGANAIAPIAECSRFLSSLGGAVGPILGMHNKHDSPKEANKCLGSIDLGCVFCWA